MEACPSRINGLEGKWCPVPFFHDVIVRESNPPKAIEFSAEKVRMLEAPTFQYDGPVYALTPTTVPNSGKINAGKLGAAMPGRPAPPREPGSSNLGGAQQGGPAASRLGAPGADNLKLARHFDRSLGLSVGNGVRLEVDIQCDERLSPRIYQVRYMRFRDSGERLVDVMLKYSQPPPR